MVAEPAVYPAPCGGRAGGVSRAVSLGVGRRGYDLAEPACPAVGDSTSPAVGDSCCVCIRECFCACLHTNAQGNLHAPSWVILRTHSLIYSYTFRNVLSPMRMLLLMFLCLTRASSVFLCFCASHRRPVITGITGSLASDDMLSADPSRRQRVFLQDTARG